MKTFSCLLLLLFAACAAPSPTVLAPVEPTPCSYCAAWNEPHAPLQVFGNTYYVGTNGLSALLVTSPEGHILIDGALPESAPLIAANIQALGFRLRDVKWILNAHAHYDHAGGIAALQRATGATVAASPSGARVLEAGQSGPDDPQYGELLPFPAAQNVRVLTDGEVVRIGSVALTAHFTPGHTAGGTTWTWQSCQDGRCLDLVYADSLTPVSEEGYRFSESTRYPNVLADFAYSFGVVEGLSCDLLLAPHPIAANLWERVAAREAGDPEALVDTEACARYADAARQRLARRLEAEQ